MLKQKSSALCSLPWGRVACLKSVSWEGKPLTRDPPLAHISKFALSRTKKEWRLVLGIWIREKEGREEPGVVMVRNRAKGTFSRSGEALSRCRVPALGGRRRTQTEMCERSCAERCRGREDRGGSCPRLSQEASASETTDAILVQRVLQEMPAQQAVGIRGEARQSPTLEHGTTIRHQPGCHLDQEINCWGLPSVSLVERTPPPWAKKDSKKILCVKPLGAIP